MVERTAFEFEFYLVQRARKFMHVNFIWKEREREREKKNGMELPGVNILGKEASQVLSFFFCLL